MTTETTDRMAELAESMRQRRAPSGYESPAELAERVRSNMRRLGDATELAYLQAGLERPPADDAERRATDDAILYYGAYSITMPDGTMLGRHALAMPLQYAQIGRSGDHYRLGAIVYPHTGHARVSFTHPEGIPVSASTLRARGKRVLEALLGESITVHASVYNRGSGYIVQGWRKDWTPAARNAGDYPPAGAIL